jgi:hypothetical protein
MGYRIHHHQPINVPTAGAQVTTSMEKIGAIILFCPRHNKGHKKKNSERRNKLFKLQLTRTASLSLT